MKSLSIVSTSMQLVNSIEALHFYSCKRNHLLIWTSNHQRVNQMIRLLEFLDSKDLFEKITVVCVNNGFYPLVLLKERIALKKVVKKIKYDCIIVGNYKLVRQRFVLYQSFSENSQPKIVLIDDGAAVVDTVRRRNNELISHKADYYIKSRLLRFFYLSPINIVSLNLFVPSNVTFFTAYWDLQYSPNDVVHQNHYERIKNILECKTNCIFYDSLKLIILGQPLTQFNYLTKEDASHYIVNAISQLGLSYEEVVYVPHPGEKKSYLLSHELEEKVTIQLLEFPFEIYALSLNKTTQVIGFWTSALINIRKIRPDINIYSIRINDDDFQGEPEMLTEINALYKYMKKNGVTLIGNDNVE